MDSKMDTETGEMIVKRVSVPIGLEELMEGLVKEVLLKKPDDIYFFAAKYFSQLLLLRDKGQNKVKTIRSAQSLTEQREKRNPTKIPVSGVTKQLSRQFSIRGESPVKNFDSPIISQKPKMYDRHESKYKRRNTGPPTIPENHINIAVRKKYSRSVSTERKKEIIDSNNGTQKSQIRKRNITRKDYTDVNNESNKTSDRIKNGGKRNSVTKELQNTSLIKNVPTDGVTGKLLLQKETSEENAKRQDSQPAAETEDLIDEVHEENKILQDGTKDSSESHENKDLGDSELENNNNSKSKLADGSDHSKENATKSVVDDTVQEDNNEIETEIEKSNEDKLSRKDKNIKQETSENVQGENNVNNEITEGGSPIEVLSEKSIVPSDTLDSLTMESENGEKRSHEESRPISVVSNVDEKGTSDNSTSAFDSDGLRGSEVKSKTSKNESETISASVNDRTNLVDTVDSDNNIIDNKIDLFHQENISKEKTRELKNETNSDQLLHQNFPEAHADNREDGESDKNITEKDNEVGDDVISPHDISFHNDQAETNTGSLTEHRKTPLETSINDSNSSRIEHASDEEKLDFAASDEKGVSEKIRDADISQNGNIDSIPDNRATETILNDKEVEAGKEKNNNDTSVNKKAGTVDDSGKEGIVSFDETPKSLTKEPNGEKKYSTEEQNEESTSQYKNEEIPRETVFSSSEKEIGNEVKDNTEMDTKYEEVTQSDGNHKDTMDRAEDSAMSDQSTVEDDGRKSKGNVMLDKNLSLENTKEDTISRDQSVEKKENHNNNLSRDSSILDSQVAETGRTNKDSESQIEEPQNNATVVNNLGGSPETKHLSEVENEIEKDKDESGTKKLEEHTGKGETDKNDLEGNHKNLLGNSNSSSEDHFNHEFVENNSHNGPRETKGMPEELFDHPETDKSDNISKTANLDENLKESETQNNHNNSTQSDTDDNEVNEDIFIKKETGKLSSNNTVINNENKYCEGESDSLRDEKSLVNVDGYAHEKHKERSTVDENKSELSAIDDKNDLQPNSESKNCKIVEATRSEDVSGDNGNSVHDHSSSERKKRSLEKEDIISSDTVIDKKDNVGNENTAGVESGKVMSKDENTHKSIDEETDPKDHSNGTIKDEDSETSDKSKSELNSEIIDKVAKNYTNYVIDKKKYLDYDDTDKENQSEALNIAAEEDGDISKHSESNLLQNYQPDSSIQKNETENKTSFDRSKLREELGIPQTDELDKMTTDNSEHEELKKNVSSTLSVAKTGLIDTPVKTFINDFISNERHERSELNKLTPISGPKVVQTTTAESEIGVTGDSVSEHKKNLERNEPKSNNTFDRSKLREELQKIEQESKQTSFKNTFNPSLLRQEIDQAVVLKNKPGSNGYSGTLAKAAAVLRIQSMWRGFIVRKSFPKSPDKEDSSAHRDENSNVYPNVGQEADPNAGSVDEKETNRDVGLIKAVTTIQKFWRGFRVRKHLNSLRLDNNSSSLSARSKTQAKDNNFDFFDTTRAAIKIQKIWRGFIARKKLKITKRTNTSHGHENIAIGASGGQVDIQKTPMETEYNSDVNKEEISKENSVGNSKSEGIPGHHIQNSMDDEKNKVKYATKIQSLWRGFLVRKYVEKLKERLKEKEIKEVEVVHEESQRPASIDSNDSSTTVIFNGSNKKSHDEDLSEYAVKHRNFDDDNTSLDEILDYPSLKDEHFIDDYQNKLLDMISGKQTENENTDVQVDTLGTPPPKRIEEIKAEDMKDIGALHTSLLPKNVSSEKIEPQVEQIRPKSKLESVVEETTSPTNSETTDMNQDHEESFAPPCEPKIINEKPLSDYVEELGSTQNNTSTTNDESDYTSSHHPSNFEHSKSLSEMNNKNEYSKVSVRCMSLDSMSKEMVDSKLESGAAKVSPESINQLPIETVDEPTITKSPELQNAKLLHSGEWHDTVVVPLPKNVSESLKMESGESKTGRLQASEASQKSIDSTASISSIGLLHTGELHDGIVVPISLSRLERTASSNTNDSGLDTVDSHHEENPNPDSLPDDHGLQDHVNNPSPVAVQVLQAPEPEVVTSPATASSDDGAGSAHVPRKDALPIQSQFSPPVPESMESGRAARTEDRNMEAQAATKIQAGFRGYQVRKQLKLKNGSSDMNPAKRQCRVKSQCRSDSAKSQNNRCRAEVEEKSAVKIQAGVRGFLVRQRQKKQHQES